MSIIYITKQGLRLGIRQCKFGISSDRKSSNEKPEDAQVYTYFPDARWRTSVQICRVLQSQICKFKIYNYTPLQTWEKNRM
jgi:hypothetical protein